MQLTLLCSCTTLVHFDGSQTTDRRCVSRGSQTNIFCDGVSFCKITTVTAQTKHLILMKILKNHTPTPLLKELLICHIKIQSYTTHVQVFQIQTFECLNKPPFLTTAVQ